MSHKLKNKLKKREKLPMGMLLLHEMMRSPMARLPGVAPPLNVNQAS